MGIRMTARNIEIAREAYAAYAHGDVEAAGKAFAPDALIYGPVAHGEFETVDWTARGGFGAFVAQIAENWRIVSYDLMRLEAEGEWVTAFIHIAALNWKTQKRVEAVTVDVLRFRDGLCVEFHEMIDRDALKAAARS
jgi:ketosteroid isomerase-like protein